jgi:S-methylmethionine-dependent homocysteine/selenocysteine methylase
MVILLDGGMGSELRLRGVEVASHTESFWSAGALLDNPDAVVDIHASYIEVGADILTINNYAVTPPLLAREGMEHRVEELTELAVDLAEQACSRSGCRPRLAGSLPPLETSYRADLIKDRDEVLDGYRRIATVLAPCVDLMICETMASSQEAVWACQAAAETGREFWVSWTLHGNRMNTLPSGESLADAFAALGDLKPTAYLVNCCGANFVGAGLEVLAGLTDDPVGGFANAETVVPGGGGEGVEVDPESAQQGGATPLDPEAYASEVQTWLEAGATIVGGCCRTRPEHIRRLREMLSS